MDATFGEGRRPSGIAMVNRLQKQGLPIERCWLAEGAGHV